jgi:methyl-accepting chemotaxis protein
MQYRPFRLKVGLNVFLVINIALIWQEAVSYVANAQLYGGPTAGAIFGAAVSNILVLSIPITLLLAGIVVWSLQPLHRVASAFSRLEQVSKEEYFKARKATIRLSAIIIAGNIVAFSFGLVLQAIGNPQFFASLQGIMNALFMLASSGLFAFVQISINHLILARPRAILNIQQLDERRGEREMGILPRNLLTTVFLLAYGLLFTAIIAHGVISYQNLQIRAYEQVVSGEASVEEAGSLEKSDLAAAEALSGTDMASFNILERKISLGGAEGILFFTFLFILVLGIGLQFASSKVLQLQVRRMRDKMNEMAGGEVRLDDYIPVEQFNEAGQLASGINRFIATQKEFIEQLASIGEQVRSSSSRIKTIVDDSSSAAEEMAASIDQVSRNARSQRDTVEQTGESLQGLLESLNQITENVETQAGYVEQSSSSMTEMAESIRSVSETTRKASEVSEELERTASDGHEAVDNSIRAIKQIEDASNEVSELVSVISDIAGQTDLLSMNAAIEAAHAGEAGKGFAVVAEEIRKLATTSSESAKTIDNQLSTMLELVSNGVQLSENAGTSLDNISSGVQKTNGMIREITSAMEEQNEGANQILESTGSLVEATEKIRSIVEEQKSRNSEMNEAIQNLVNSFQEIQHATSEQSAGTGKIVDSINELQTISEENSKVVERLGSLLSNFKEDRRELSAQELSYRKSREAETSEGDRSA